MKTTRIAARARTRVAVAFTPKGGCPLKKYGYGSRERLFQVVAFTPKGGCPLKRATGWTAIHHLPSRSIHPQGWVPVETFFIKSANKPNPNAVAFTPKGGCPLKHIPV